MPDSLRAGLLFLVTSLFDLYLFILIVRIILVWVGSNYFDPLTQFIIKLTNFIVRPLRKLIPNVRSLELSSILLVLILEIIKFVLISLLNFGIPNFFGILIIALGDVLKNCIQIFFYAILLQAIISWFQPGSPVNRVLAQVTSPLMRPLHRLIPPVGGIDISPIPALIILQLLTIMVASPLIQVGMGVAFG